MLVLIAEDALFCNNVNITIKNANIKTTQQSSESLFMGFFRIVFNSKNLKSSIKYKKKTIKGITHYIYNYFVQKFYFDNF